MPHHLGNTLNRYACLQCQRTERMAGYMKGKGLSNATSQTYSLEVHTYLYSTHRGCKDGGILFLVFQWVKREYLLGNRVQGRNALYTCLSDISKCFENFVSQALGVLTRIYAAELRK